MPLSGSLVWPVKLSLLDYLTAIEGATISGTRASRAPDAPFTFVESEFSTVAAPSYLGQIRIVAHGGLMNIDLIDPVVTPDSDRWVVTFRTATGDTVNLIRLAAIDEQRRGGLLIRSSADVSLLLEGVSLFGGRYEPYTRMAPLEFSSDVSRAPSR